MLLCRVHCWSASKIDKDNWSLPVILYCSAMMYKYYSFLVFILVKHNEKVKYILKEAFNNLQHFIKNIIHVNCIRIGFVRCNYTLLIRKQEVIIHIHNSMIPMALCQKNQCVINFTTDEMISKFEVLTNHKLDTFYLT